MVITDLCTDQSGVLTYDIARMDCLTAISRFEERTILQETHMDVSINGVPSIKMVCTPKNLAALILGHLFSEGRIAGTTEIASIFVSEDGTHAEVTTTVPLTETKPPVEIRTCNCGENGMMGRAVDTADLTPLPDFRWECRWVHDLARTFGEGAPLYKLTHGIHSCFLMKEGEIRYICEDIGRHNALDKVLGCALMDGVDLSDCVLFSSGRIPDDMITKVLRARVPMLISNAVPTHRAVELARKYHINLICSARCDGMDIFSSKGLWD